MNPPIDTRVRLVEAARDLFLLQGYNATGIAQILRQSGANSGSLYHFFPTKEDLLIAVLEWYRDNIWEGLLQPVFTRIDDPIERVFGVLDGYRQMLMMLEFEQGCPIGNLSLELANSHPKARELMVLNFENWKAAIGQCITAARGRLPESIEPQRLATLVLCVMEGAVMLARSYRHIAPFDEAVLQLREYFDRLIAEGTRWGGPQRASLGRIVSN
ncbi:TetR/AcrR family transcriptional regulator [bacterium]|nr:TetR/AcrR family transcriptional regulator [bacterium]